jgi:diguanylate cyclase (GGDEF)-like protein/PAS domain S-box-containing protein
MQVDASQRAGDREMRGDRQALAPESIPLRSVIEAMTDAVVVLSARGRPTQMNESARAMLRETLGLPHNAVQPGLLPAGWSRLDEHGSLIGEEQSLARQVLVTGRAQKNVVMGLQNPSGTRTWFSLNAHPILHPEGGLDGVVITWHDITERKKAEQERAAHLHFVESLDRVNSAIHGAQDLQQMLSDVLDAVLAVLKCDRAYLVFPCDPEAPTWTSPMQRSRPPYQPSLPINVPIAVDPVVAACWREVLKSDDPVRYGPGGDQPLPPETAAQYGFHTGMTMALYPNTGKPWAFSVLQCSHERRWNAADCHLMRQIGRRLADGLTSMLTRQALQKREMDFRRLAEHSPDWIARLDLTGRFLYVNPMTERLFGLSPTAYFGKRVDELDLTTDPELSIDPKELTDLSQGVLAAAGTGENQQCTLRMVRANVPLVYDCRMVPERDASGTLVGVLCMARDITEIRRNEIVLKSLNRSLRLLSKCNQLLIDARDEETLLTDVCRLIVETGGYVQADVYTNETRLGSVRRLAGFPDAASADTVIVRVADASGVSEPILAALQTATIQVCPAFLRGRRSSIAIPVRDSRGLSALSIVARGADRFLPEEMALLRELADDLSFGLRMLQTRREHRAAEEQLSFLARHDLLTKLPNRLLLREHFEKAMADAHARDAQLSLVFVDLDGFKGINDSLGHEAGDDLLAAVAARLKGCIREHDIVSREGGDEFLLVLTDAGRNVALEAAQRILDQMQPPFRVGDADLHVSASLGISVYPDDGADFETLRRNADAALFQSKDSGRNTYRFFDQQMNVDAAAQVGLHASLRRALQSDEFQLHYQPLLNLRDGRILGAEALIRWHRPDGTLIPPAAFIPVAERSGLIIPIGEWVLNEACRQAMIWRKRLARDLSIAVNLSVAQFARGNIVEAVLNALNNSGLPAHALELELTESVLLRDTEVALQTMTALKGIGARLAIDDFGTGFSSLAYVKRLPVDKLKIDRSFIKDLAESPQDTAIVKSIIQLAHTLQLQVTAEGVETVGQLAVLRDFGCDQIQGYLISRPLPHFEVLKLLQDETATATAKS